MKNDMECQYTGGSAFPVIDRHEEVVAYGMTLRDWFAGQATDKDINDVINRRKKNGQGPTSRAEAKFIYAREMLAAREGQDDECKR